MNSIGIVHNKKKTRMNRMMDKERATTNGTQTNVLKNCTKEGVKPTNKKKRRQNHGQNNKSRSKKERKMLVKIKTPTQWSSTCKRVRRHGR